MEILLSDAFLLLSAHLTSGKTDPETIDPEWRADKRAITINLKDFIDSTLQEKKVIENLKELTPGHSEYNNLKKALEKYRRIEQEGGWEEFTTSLSKIEKGMQHPDVAILRKRLAIAQGIIDFTDEFEFDQPLHDQVILFQTRNGLTADGVVSKATIGAMNIPVRDRIASIKANMERWRWLSDDLGEYYIKVNIANFELRVIEDNRSVFISEAIVGKPYRKTPVFSSVMNYLVFNPSWTIPPGILYNDVIPAIRRNPDYLKEKNMKVLRGDGTEADPASINWNGIVTGSFPYRIRQEPGREHALGKVKFMFPNQYNVYIHDTPARNLFVHPDRSFSSGCIRINKA